MGFHHGTGRAQRLHLAVTCNVTVAIVKTIVIVAYWPYQSTQIYLWLCSINELQRGHRSQILALFGRNFVCHVTYLPIHRRRDHGSNFLITVTYSIQSNSKLYVLKNDYVPNTPVELAQYGKMAGYMTEPIISLVHHGYCMYRSLHLDSCIYTPLFRILTHCGPSERVDIV